MEMSKEFDPLSAVLAVLTITTGLVDAVSVLGLQRVFTANMTGNVVFLGFALAGEPGFSVPHSLAALVGFVVGALAGGRLGVVFSDASRRRWLFSAAMMEALLLFAAAGLAIGYDTEATTPLSVVYAMIVLTAVAMGLRNSTVRRLAIPDLTTTVLTLTLTGLAADSTLAGGSNTRWGRRVVSVIAMLTGAVLGAVLLSAWGLALPLLVAGACLLLATVAYVLHPASLAAARNDAR